MDTIDRQLQSLVFDDDDKDAVDNINFDYYQSVARSAFADMLHDTERNRKYYLGLKAAIEKTHLEQKVAHVLDIGAGTGLLSMMAVKLGADSVTACEAFQPVADCTKEILKVNGVADKIKLIPKNSMDVKVGGGAMELAQRANILVTEIFDTELIGEGALGIFAHAHKELLEEECIVVPKSATIFAQIVECPLALSWHKLKCIVDTDDGYPIVRMPALVEECEGSSAVHDLQLSQLPVSQFRALAPPVAALRFEWAASKEVVRERSTVHEVRCEATGVAHAVFMWWQLEMDVHAHVRLSCAPFWAHPDYAHSGASGKDSVPWRDHWMQAVYYLPRQLSVRRGGTLTLISSHDEYSLWFQVSEQPGGGYARNCCACALHTVLPRSRIGQLNDGTRVKRYLAVLRQRVTPTTVALVLSDASLLPFVVAKLGARRVYAVLQVPLLERTFLEVARANGVDDRVTFVKSARDCSPDVNLVLAEPYFAGALLPWDNLRFFDTIKEELEGVLRRPDVAVVPAKLVLNAIAIDFNNLHKIKEVVHECEGFNVAPFKDLIEASSERADAPVEPQPLWEYPGRALTLPTAIQEFHIDTYQPADYLEHVHPLEIRTCGLLKGVALWMDIHLDESPSTRISTGPKAPVEVGDEVQWDMYTRQGVYLLRQPLPVQTGDVVYVKMYYTRPHMTFAFQLNHLDI